MASSPTGLTDSELRASPLDTFPAVPSDKTGRTHVQASATADGTLHTVTAGKTLYILSAWVTGANDGTAAAMAQLVTGAGESILRMDVASAGIDTPGISHGLAIAYPEPFQVAATGTVTLSSTTDAASAGFVGYEE